MKHFQGVPIGTDSSEAIEALAMFRDGFLGWRAAAPVSAHKAHDADPECVLTNTLLATGALALERLDAPTRAQPYLDAARRNLSRASDYERKFLVATTSWAEGRGADAVAQYEQVIEAYPQDLVSVKIAQFHHFLRGNSYGLLRCSERSLQACPTDAYAHGLAAFGYCESNRFNEAEQVARRGVELLRREVWAHHALAHVMEMQGRYEEGAEWLGGVVDTWSDCNRELSAHMTWHRALYYLAMERHAEALALFDNGIWGPDASEWGGDKDLTRFPLHAVGLLWRLNLAGVDVGARWSEVASRIANRALEPVEPFPTLLYLYALEKGGQKAAVASLIEAISVRARTADTYSRKTWMEIGLPAAHGMLAHARGDYEAAWRQLAPVSHAWLDLGGSRAQQGVFHETWIDTLIHSGHDQQALRELQLHATTRASSPKAWRDFATICDRCGRASDAQSARARASELELRYRRSN